MAKIVNNIYVGATLVAQDHSPGYYNDPWSTAVGPTIDPVKNSAAKVVYAV